MDRQTIQSAKGFLFVISEVLTYIYSILFNRINSFHHITTGYKNDMHMNSPIL